MKVQDYSKEIYYVPNIKTPLKKRMWRKGIFGKVTDDNAFSHLRKVYTEEIFKEK
jgi:hypothetical protein